MGLWWWELVRSKVTDRVLMMMHSQENLVKKFTLATDSRSNLIHFWCPRSAGFAVVLWERVTYLLTYLAPPRERERERERERDIQPEVCSCHIGKCIADWWSIKGGVMNLWIRESGHFAQPENPWVKCSLDTSTWIHPFIQYASFGFTHSPSY